jgi:hypothetical protein
MVNSINKENAEFVSNLAFFYLNVLMSDGGMISVHSELDLFKTVISFVMLQNDTPQHIFMQ